MCNTAHFNRILLYLCTNTIFLNIIRTYKISRHMGKTGKILIVDDNEDVLFALNVLLSPHVEKIKVTTNPESIPRFLDEFMPDIILLDMNYKKDVISGAEGLQWLEKILKINPMAVVIMITAYADTAKAVKAIKAGATDFIAKPWENDKLIATINAALKLCESQRKSETLQNQILNINNENTDRIIGESDEMKYIFGMIEKIAETDANVLILGENGTGKDLIARNIHNKSARANKVFVSIDLGTISESLFESELFGYEKGAFTDAKKEKQGRIEIASGGTLFLDEIANLSSAMQAKMLTAIEKRYISRLGATKNIPVNVRFISATNADIYKNVENGNFRRDLLYRINTIEINIPPLRERGDDIILLANHFISKFSNKYKKDIRGLSKEAVKKLSVYSWPGNVRELQNSVERAVIMASGRLLKSEDFFLASNGSSRYKHTEEFNLEKLEQNTIKKAIECAEGNLNKAAELLGISRFALYRKIDKA